MWKYTKNSLISRWAESGCPRLELAQRRRQGTSRVRGESATGGIDVGGHVMLVPIGSMLGL
jgi:hypothetical protein